MSTHNICFRGEIKKILCGYPLLSVAMTTAFFYNTTAGIQSKTVLEPKQIYIENIEK